MDLRHPGAVGERLAIGGHSGLVGADHHGIGDDHCKQTSVVAGGHNLPAFVSSELGKREPARHFHGVLVLRERAAAENRRRNDDGSRNALTLHFRPLSKSDKPSRRIYESHLTGVTSCLPFSTTYVASSAPRPLPTLLSRGG